MGQKQKTQEQLDIVLDIIQKYITDDSEAKALKTKYTQEYFRSLVQDYCNSFYRTRNDDKSDERPCNIEEILQHIDQFVKDPRNYFIRDNSNSLKKEIATFFVTRMCDNISRDNFAKEYFKWEDDS